MNYNDYMMRNDKVNLFTPEQGYNLGNMFSNLYDPYKNYKPTELKANTQQERDYLELSRTSFAMHEMNLYLDIHPEDRKIQNLFNDYRKMFVEQERKYEQKYGPLTTTSNAMEKTPFPWEQEVWPWEGELNV